MTMLVSMRIPPIMPVAPSLSFRNVYPSIAVTSGLNAQNNPEIDADNLLLCNWLKREAKAGAYYC